MIYHATFCKDAFFDLYMTKTKYDVLGSNLHFLQELKTLETHVICWGPLMPFFKQRWSFSRFFSVDLFFDSCRPAITRKPITFYNILLWCIRWWNSYQSSKTIFLIFIKFDLQLPKIQTKDMSHDIFFTFNSLSLKIKRAY